MPTMREQAALEVLVGGRYGGMTGMAAFENDLNRISSGFRKTFVDPFQSPQGLIDERYAKAASAAEKAALARRDAEIALQKVSTGGLSLQAQRVRALSNEERALNSVQKAELSLTRAREAERNALNKALTSPTATHANRFAVGASQQRRQIAEQDLANAKMSSDAMKMERQAAEANLPVQNALLQQTATKRAQYARDMETAANKEQQAAADYARRLRMHRPFGIANAVSMPGMIAGGAIVGGAVYSGVQAARWQTGIASLGSIASMTPTEQAWLERYGPGVMQQMPASQQQILTGYQYARQAGYQYGDALSLTKRVLRSAIPTGADPGQIMFTLTALLKQFGYDGKNAVSHARPLLDYIHQAAASGQMNIGQFANVYGQVGGFAQRAESPQVMLQSMALLSTLTQMHIPYAQAATQARGFLQQVLAPRPMAQKLLDELRAQGNPLYKDYSAAGLRTRGIGGIFQDIQRSHLTDQELRVLFPNMRGSLAAQLVSTGEGQKTFNRIYQGIQNAPSVDHGKGITTEEYDNYMKKAGPQLRLLKTNMVALEIAIGQGVLPMMLKFAREMTPIIKNLAAWIKQHQSLVSGVAKFGAILLGVSIGVRALSFVMEPLVTGVLPMFAKGFMGLVRLMVWGIPEVIAFGASLDLAFLPVTAIVLGLAALGVGLYLAYTHIKIFHDGVNRLGGALKTLFLHPIDSAKAVLTWFGKHWAEGLLLLLTGPFVALPLFITATFFPHLNNEITHGFDKFQGWLKGKWNSLIQSGLENPFSQFIMTLVGWELSVFKIGAEWLNAFISGFLSAEQKLPDGVKKVLEAAIPGFSLLDAVASTHGKSAMDKFANSIKAGKNDVVNSVAQVLAAASGTLNGWAGTAHASSARGFSNSAYPGGNVFGMPQSNAYNELTNPNYPGGRAGAAAMAGVPNATVHSDIPEPVGTKVRLPGGKNAHYKLIAAGYDPKGGNFETWGTPGGGEITFYHLSNKNARQLSGQLGGFTGGDVVALTGNTGSNTSGPHLHVGMNAAAARYVYNQTGGNGWNGNNLGGQGGQQGTGNWPPAIAQYRSIILAAARQYGIDPNLIASIIMQESSGNRNAIGPMTKSGRAYGLMQVMEFNFPQVGLTKNNWNDPQANIFAGTKILAGDLNSAKIAGAGNRTAWALNAYSGGATGYSSAVMSRAKAYSKGFTPSATNNLSYSAPSSSGASNWQQNSYGAYPNEVGPDGMPVHPGKNGMTNARYWYLMASLDAKNLHATFPGDTWRHLHGAGLKLYQKDQSKVYYDQEKAALGKVDNWWAGLTPAQRNDPGFQAAYQVQRNQVKRTYRSSMGNLAGKIADQPLYNRAFDMHSNYQNLHDIWGLIPHPWTLPKGEQNRWLQGQRSMDWYWGQYQAANARLQEKQLEREGMSRKDAMHWLSQRLGAIWAAQSQKDANALYKLQHHGSTSGAAGRVVPVHVVGHCAAEAAANTHRKKAGQGATDTAKHTASLDKHTQTVIKKLDDLIAAVKGQNAQRPGVGHSPGGPVHPSVRDPRYKGRTHKPGSV